MSGTEDVLSSVLSANWALEEASGEASEGPAPRGPEPAPSRLGEGSARAEAARHSNLLSASPLRGPAKSQPLAGGTGTPRPQGGPGRPAGQARSPTADKTDRPPVPPRDAQEPGSARPLPLHPRGPSRPSTLAAQPGLPGSPAWDRVPPLGGPQGRKSIRARRSTAGRQGGPSEGAAAPHAHLNPVPLADTGGLLPPASPQAGEFVRPLLVPGVALVLLAVGGLLLHRRRRRVRRAWWPRGGHLPGTWHSGRRSRSGQAGWGAAWVFQTLTPGGWPSTDESRWTGLGGSGRKVSGRAGAAGSRREYSWTRSTWRDAMQCGPGQGLGPGRRRQPSRAETGVTSTEASGSSCG